MSDSIINDLFADQGVQPIDPATQDVLNELIQRKTISTKKSPEEDSLK